MSLSGLKQQRGVLQTGEGSAMRKENEDSNTEQPQNEITFGDLHDSVREMPSELDTRVIAKPLNQLTIIEKNIQILAY